MELRTPYLLFVGDAPDDLAAKTATGIIDWRRDWCVGQVRLDGCRAAVDLPAMSVAEGAEAGARTLVIGVVNRGGVLPDSWIATLTEALGHGMDLASGLHIPLATIPALRDAAERHGRALHEVRVPARSFSVGTGEKRSGRRLLCVGTDCSVGKKYAALALERDMTRRGLKATFRATGQTGVFIAGRGVAVDAVVSDFVAGAAEWLSPANEPDHWDVIEGQGSLFHPSYAGVSLGLLHGSQPDALVLCHEPTRTALRGVDYPLPDLKHCVQVNETLGRLTNPACACIGVAVNTGALDREVARACLDAISAEVGLPAVDPMADGTDAILDNLPA